MNYKIIDNFLPKEEFEDIKSTIFQIDFPWNLSNEVTTEKENLPTEASYYFTHVFWFGFDVEQQAQMFSNLLQKIECRALVRIKANLYPSTKDIIHHENHVDFDFEHKGAIFYLNTNNGLTILEDKIEVQSVENRLLLFDPTKLHRSTTCTDSKFRANINFNFY